ncbi:MAG: glycosyltransferase [Candidatus Thiodiazotropha taylori]|uniref:Glycosyltransferase n=1 Tax=Candidatus Thiodiazotropha taylori TaxID=2792791 RepID=A0A9E4K9Q3_9GAMM|nr:glycosyltransferase [Candidatus Thiodiazotropha taylori]MCW4255078.1 glycosyltransferase [Candidatus Thiodiazotropha taylori]
MKKPLKIFVGWDSRLGIVNDVAISSIKKHAPHAEVYPLKQFQLRDSKIYNRPVDNKASTEFTITRFLPPALCYYEGYSMFMDCDMILTTDIHKILDECDLDKTINCVKHDYSKFEQNGNHGTVKMDGRHQEIYPRKNWSSVMVFNNAKCKETLTPDYINQAEPKHLHRMTWANEDIGEIQHRWNYLVGYHTDEDYSLIHWTDGGPWFDDYRDPPLSDLWYNELFDHFEAKKLYNIERKL